MELGLYTDSVADLSFDEALDFSAEMGIKAVEVAAGGVSAAPHMRLADLLREPAERSAFADKISARGMRLSAINCTGWPLHPEYGDRHAEIVRAAIRLAGELGVDKIVTASGCPRDSPRASTVNWLALPWTSEAPGLLEQQWGWAIEAWQELADLAAASGVQRIALELVPMHLVYNVPTLQRLRQEVGPLIGANVDPSHFFWQQIDPLAVVKALGPMIHHVHLKDLVFNDQVLAVTGVLDPHSFGDPGGRSWMFRTVGTGHPASFWKAFVEALRDADYDDVLSIENEDPLLPGENGVQQAVDFMSTEVGVAFA